MCFKAEQIMKHGMKLEQIKKILYMQYINKIDHITAVKLIV